MDNTTTDTTDCGKIIIRSRYRFLFSGFSGNSDEQAELARRIQLLGGVYYNTEEFKPNCTHVVCARLSRSEKFLGACASGKWVVTPDFINDSFNRKRWLDENDYQWSINDLPPEHPSVFKELCYAPVRNRIIINEKKSGLFKGWKVFLLIQNKKRKAVYKRLLLAGGAQIIPCSVANFKPRALSKRVDYVFVDCKNSFCVKSLLRAKALCLSTDYIRNYLLRVVSPSPKEFDITTYVPNTDLLSKITCLDSPIKSSPPPSLARSPFKTSAAVKQLVNFSPIKLVPLVTPIDKSLLENQTNGRRTKDCSIVMRQNSIRKFFSVQNDVGNRENINVSRHTPTNSKKKSSKTNICNKSSKSATKRKSTESHNNSSPCKRRILSERVLLVEDCPMELDSENENPSEENLKSALKNMCMDDLTREKLTILWNSILELQKKLFTKHWQKKIGKVSSYNMAEEYPGSYSHYLEACYEDGNLLGSIANLRRMLCNEYFFPLITMKIIINKLLLEAPTKLIANQAHNLLIRILRRHPPTNSVRRQWYLHILAKESFSNLRSSIGKSLSGCCTPYNGGDDDVRQWSYALYIDYFRSVLEMDFAFLITRAKDVKKLLSVPNCQPLVVRIIWPSGSIHLNRECSQLLRYLVSAVINTVTFNVITNVQKIVTLMMECCFLSEAGEVNYFCGVGDKSLALVHDLVSCMQNEKADANNKFLLLVFETLESPWVKMIAAQLLLDSIIQSSITYSRYQPLTLQSILYHYMQGRPDGTSTTSMIELSKSSPVKNGTIASRSTSPIKIGWKNLKGESHLHLACTRGQFDRVCQLLQIPEINVNVKDHNGWTPLHEACNFGHFECAKELINYKPILPSLNVVDLTAVSSDGVSPLHDAVANGHLDICKLLLEHGGSKLLDIKTKDGYLPLDLAKSDEVREILLDGKWKKESTVDSDSESTNKVVSYKKLFGFVNLVLRMLWSYLDNRHLPMFCGNYSNDNGSPLIKELIATKLEELGENELDNDVRTFIEDVKLYCSLDKYVGGFSRHVSGMLEVDVSPPTCMSLFTLMSLHTQAQSQCETSPANCASKSVADI